MDKMNLIFKTVGAHCMCPVKNNNTKIKRKKIERGYHGLRGRTRKRYDGLCRGEPACSPSCEENLSESGLTGYTR